jgi:hypothetical protein
MRSRRTPALLMLCVPHQGILTPTLIAFEAAQGELPAAACEGLARQGSFDCVRQPLRGLPHFAQDDRWKGTGASGWNFEDGLTAAPFCFWGENAERIFPGNRTLLPPRHC